MGKFGQPKLTYNSVKVESSVYDQMVEVKKKTKKPISQQIQDAIDSVDELDALRAEVSRLKSKIAERG